MDKIIILVLSIHIILMFTILVKYLISIETEIKKQNEYWINIDRHFDKMYGKILFLISRIENQEGDK